MDELLKSDYTDGRGRIHVETIIGGAAALTGEFALRAAGLPWADDGAPGFVFGDAINDVLYEGAMHGHATVWEILKTYASNAGVKERELPDIKQVFANVAGAIASNMPGATGKRVAFPPFTVPTANYPLEWSPNACPRLRKRVMAIASRRDLTARELAFALAMTTGGLIEQAKDLLAPAVGLRLAVEITWTVAKMKPVDKAF